MDETFWFNDFDGGLSKFYKGFMLSISRSNFYAVCIRGVQLARGEAFSVEDAKREAMEWVDAYIIDTNHESPLPVD